MECGDASPLSFLFSPSAPDAALSSPAEKTKPKRRYLAALHTKTTPEAGPATRPAPMTTALLLIAHGSRNPDANADLHHVARELERRGHPVVVPSFLELAEPGIEEGGRRCVERGADVVVLLPYFLSAGVHVRRDLTAAREHLARRFPGVEF